MVFDLKLGFTCNNNCVHCVVADKRRHPDISTKELESIILNDSGLDVIVFTGGEPTIRDDFLHLLEFAYHNGAKAINIQTNGRAFADYEFSKKVSKFANSILIAVHSHNEIIHDMITQRKGSWRETTRGLKNLMDIRAVVQTQTVLSKLNCDNLLKTYDFIQSVSPGARMNLTFPHANGSAWTNFKTVVPKYSSIKKEIHKCFAKYGHKICSEAIPLCYIHPYVNQVSVSEDRFKGNVKIRGLDISNAGNGGFFDSRGITDNYNDSLLSDLRKPKSCVGCIYNNECFGVWKEYYERYENELDLKPIT